MLKKIAAMLLAVLMLGQCASAWADNVTELVFTQDSGSYTISSAGTYRLTGETANGQLVIAAEKKSRITLILTGVSIACADGPVIRSENSVDVTIVLESGTENRLVSGTAVEIGAEKLEEDVEGAAIKLKGDLTIEGEGALFVGGYINNGVQASGDVKIKSGTVTVEARHNGIRGKEGVKIKGGSVAITSGNDGVSASDEEKGAVTISGGDVAIQSWGDAVQAQTALTVEGGLLTLTTGGGSEAAPMKTGDDMWGFGGNRSGFDGWRGGKFGFNPNGKPDDRRGKEERPDMSAMQLGDMTPPEGMPQAPEGMENMTPPAASEAGGDDDSAGEADGVSRKGLKSAGIVTVSGGEIRIDSEDDAIHAENVTITGGSITAATGDDGIHADKVLTIERGELTITKSYEGLEAAMIEISGGDITVMADDDGINASDGTSEPFGGRGGWGMPNNASDTELPLLHITGGHVYVNADGDGLDSNGDLLVEGGCVVVDGPSNSANGALDSGAESGGACIVNGGTVLAIGAAGMAETFGKDSAQSYLSCNINIAAGAELVVTAADGTELIRHTAAKTANFVVFSCDTLTDGDVVTVSVNGADSQVTVQRTEFSGGFGGRGFGRW